MTPKQPLDDREDPVRSGEQTAPLATVRTGAVPYVQRDGHPRQCTAASKRSGVRCRAWAVEDMTVCRMHGGSSPQAREAARQRRTAAEATALLESVWDPNAAPVRDPVEALAALAGKAEHALDVLGARITVGDLEGATGVAWSRTMRELRQMLEGLERLGLEDRRVRLSEQMGQMLAGVVRSILSQLQLTPEQEALASTVVVAEFRRASTTSAATGELMPR